MGASNKKEKLQQKNLELPSPKTVLGKNLLALFFLPTGEKPKILHSAVYASCLCAQCPSQYNQLLHPCCSTVPIIYLSVKDYFKGGLGWVQPVCNVA